VPREINGFGDASPPFDCPAPEVLGMMERWRHEGRFGGTTDTRGPDSSLTSCSERPRDLSELREHNATASSSSSSPSWNPPKSDVWQIGMILLSLLSGGQSHDEFSEEADDVTGRCECSGATAGSALADCPACHPRGLRAEGALPAADDGDEFNPYASGNGRWRGVFPLGRSFLRSLLASDPAKRPTARQALRHPWLVRYTLPA